MPRSDLLLARFAVIGAAFLFSTGGVAIKATSLSGFELAGARSLVAVVVLLIAMPAWRRFLRPAPLVVGLAYGATMILFVVANKLTTAANAIFLQSSAPLYVLALAPWWLGERNRRIDVVLAAPLLVGLLLFFVDGAAPSSTAPQPALGNLVAVASGVTWACSLVGLRWIARGSRPDSGSAAGDAADPAALAGNAVIAGNALACLGSVALLALAPHAPRPELALRDALLVAYLGAVQIGLAYVLLTRGLHRVPALEVSLLLLLEPVSNAALAWGVYGEAPGPFALAGCALILAATAARVRLASRDDDTVLPSGP